MDVEEIQMDGASFLFVAASEGQKQIVQFLLEKGNPNVDLADKVILLIVSFSFSFFSFSFFYFFKCKGWKNSSLYCC